MGGIRKAPYPSINTGNPTIIAHTRHHQHPTISLPPTSRTQKISFGGIFILSSGKATQTGPSCATAQTLDTSYISETRKQGVHSLFRSYCRARGNYAGFFSGFLWGVQYRVISRHPVKNFPTSATTQDLAVQTVQEWRRLHTSDAMIDISFTRTGRHRSITASQGKKKGRSGFHQKRQNLRVQQLLTLSLSLPYVYFFMTMFYHSG